MTNDKDARIADLEAQNAGLLDQVLELENLRDALEAERARLALAICGGEDVPGYANAQTVETLEQVARDSQREHLRDIDRISALEAQLAERVKVKALEWKGPDCAGEYHSLGGLWGYIIRAETGNGFWLTYVGEYFPTIGAAQAAAQSHYEQRILSALEATPPAPKVTEAPKIDDAVAGLFVDDWAEAEKAIRKFPQPNYVISKVAEEAGEVVKAAIHCAEGRETAANVVAEIKQAMAMLIRLYVEGDQVHGLPPLTAAQEAGKP